MKIIYFLLQGNYPPPMPHHQGHPTPNSGFNAHPYPNMPPAGKSFFYLIFKSWKSITSFFLCFKIEDKSILKTRIIVLIYYQFWRVKIFGNFSNRTLIVM